MARIKVQGEARLTEKEWNSLPFYRLDSPFPSPEGHARIVRRKGSRPLVVYRDEDTSRCICKVVFVDEITEPPKAPTWFWADDIIPDPPSSPALTFWQI